MTNSQALKIATKLAYFLSRCASFVETQCFIRWSFHFSEEGGAIKRSNSSSSDSPNNSQHDSSPYTSDTGWTHHKYQTIKHKSLIDVDDGGRWKVYKNFWDTLGRCFTIKHNNKIFIDIYFVQSRRRKTQTCMMPWLCEIYIDDNILFIYLFIITLRMWCPTGRHLPTNRTPNQ